MHKLAILQSYLSRFAALLSLVIALSILLYGMLLLLAVSHTAARASAQRHMQEVAAQTSALESRYFGVTKAITPELAKEMGFVEPQSSETVFATAASKVLTLEGLHDL